MQSFWEVSFVSCTSEREGLAPFMMGALRAAARELYDLDIEITHRTKRGKFSDHDVFVVFVDDQR